MDHAAENRGTEVQFGVRAHGHPTKLDLTRGTARERMGAVIDAKEREEREREGWTFGEEATYQPLDEAGKGACMASAKRRMFEFSSADRL